MFKMSESCIDTCFKFWLSSTLLWQLNTDSWPAECLWALNFNANVDKLQHITVTQEAV